VASGMADKSLKILSSPPISTPSMSGLFHETRGRAQLILGKYQNAFHELKKAEEFYRSTEGPVGLSRVFNIRGLIHKKMSDFASAENSFKIAVTKAEEAKDPYNQGLVLMNLGILYQDQGLFDEAYSTYQRAFELEKKAHQPLLSCKLRENWLNLIFHMGRTAEAENACYDLLKTSVGYQYREQQASALNYLALLSGQRNHQDMQINYLNQALAFLNPHQYPQLYVQTLMNRGFAYLGMDKFFAAQLDGEEALNISERQSDSQLISWAYLLLGKIFRDRSKPDLETALIFLNKAHDLIWKNQNRLLLWQVEFDRGLLSKKRKEFERAKNYLLSAQKHLESLLMGMTEPFRQSYLRDRQMEKILRELGSIET
jgi:tetratricopeptide (TPR) repeat protein